MDNGLARNFVSDPIVTKTIVKAVSYFTVTVRNVALYTSAELEVRLFSNTDEFLDIVIISLTGTDYTNWGSEDSYITAYVTTWLQNNYGTA